jgi:hypothetical protein
MLNGAVNFDDYVLIDLAFNTQSGSLGRALSFLDGSDTSLDGMSGLPHVAANAGPPPAIRRCLRPKLPSPPFPSRGRWALVTGVHVARVTHCVPETSRRRLRRPASVEM